MKVNDASSMALPVQESRPRFYEFFAGGGMARAGLGPRWRCVFANDFDHKKGQVYQQNWGEAELRVGDVRKLTIADLPGLADLAWASFPCQDLSLAGGGAGLRGDRSGTFWPFWSLVQGLVGERRSPRLIVLENVCGTLTSHEGKDFGAICAALHDEGYKTGAVVIDAALFVPQSRPRLFLVAVHRDVDVPATLVASSPSSPWHTRALRVAHDKLRPAIKASWIWWQLPLPPRRPTNLADLIDANTSDSPWFSAEATDRLISMMSPVNHGKIAEAKRLGQRVVGSVYKRTRPNQDGRRIQRAEVRFDDVAGCLRTPAGGSSRQVILVVNGNSIAARLISSRETARLMGLPEEYELPANYNEAYHLTGDGVVVPVVRHLAAHVLEPILDGLGNRKTAAA